MSRALLGQSLFREREKERERGRDVLLYLATLTGDAAVVVASRLVPAHNARLVLFQIAGDVPWNRDTKSYTRGRRRRRRGGGVEEEDKLEWERCMMGVREGGEDERVSGWVSVMREEPDRKSRRVGGVGGGVERRRRGRSVITGASKKLLCTGPQETDTGWSIQHSWTQTWYHAGMTFTLTLVHLDISFVFIQLIHTHNMSILVLSSNLERAHTCNPTHKHLDVHMNQAQHYCCSHLQHMFRVFQCKGFSCWLIASGSTYTKQYISGGELDISKIQKKLRYCKCVHIMHSEFVKINK